MFFVNDSCTTSCLLQIFQCSLFKATPFQVRPKIFAKLRRLFQTTKLFWQKICFFFSRRSLPAGFRSWPVGLVLKSECKVSRFFLYYQIFRKEILSECVLTCVREMRLRLIFISLHTAFFLVFSCPVAGVASPLMNEYYRRHFAMRMSECS